VTAPLRDGAQDASVGEPALTGEPSPPAAPRHLGLLVAATTLVLLSGLLLAAWWLRHHGPPPPVLGELPPFTLVAQDGRSVRNADLAGHPSVVDLIFTRCQIFCPRLTERLATLGPRLPAGVRRLSISVDPAHDTPAVLATYARAHGAIAADWWFLTGPEAEVRALIIQGMKLGVVATPADDPRAEQEQVTHSTKLVLLDGRGRIRGYYDAFDDGSLALLLRDADTLAHEDQAARGGEPGHDDGGSSR
jgi:cytochrome oxidase Cu insertion factor (SCO1/SenC/PrrC family)